LTNVQSAIGNEHYGYNPLGQLTSLNLRESVPSVDYSYDPIGNRIVCGGRLFIPDHADPLKRPLIEADAATGNVLRYYLWAPGRLLGFIDAASGTLTVAHCDEYGSVVALTDEAGNTLHTACYGPNGQDWGVTGANPTPFAWLGGHGVQCVAVSEHLGPLYLTRHRLYSASLQRFLSPDPLGPAGGLNLYAYAEGDPLSYIDPLGLCAENNYWETGSYLGDVGLFFLGYGDAILDTVGGLYNMVRHPVQTAAGLVNAIAHPVQTTQAIAGGIAETWNSGNRGQGQIVGNVLIIVAATAAPYAQAGRAAKTPVLGETALKGVGDDMLVHFSQTGNRASIAANGVTTEGASYFYRVGDVKNLTAAQVRGAIGPLARGGVDNSLAVIVSPESASFTRVQMVLPEYVTMQNRVPSVLIRQVPGGAP